MCDMWSTADQYISESENVNVYKQIKISKSLNTTHSALSVILKHTRKTAQITDSGDILFAVGAVVIFFLRCAVTIQVFPYYFDFTLS